MPIPGGEQTFPIRGRVRGGARDIMISNDFLAGVLRSRQISRDYLRIFFELGRTPHAGTPNIDCYLVQAVRSREAWLTAYANQQGWKSTGSIASCKPHSVLNFATTIPVRESRTYRSIMNHRRACTRYPLAVTSSSQSASSKNVWCVERNLSAPMESRRSDSLTLCLGERCRCNGLKRSVWLLGSQTERRLTVLRDPNESADIWRAAKGGDALAIANPLKSSVRIALYKPWTANMDEGWTRFVFDTYNIPFASVSNGDVQQQDLPAKYDVIVLPSQRARELVEGDFTNPRPPEFAGGIGEAGVGRLKAFVADGGTLVCFDASCEVAIKQFNLPLRKRARGHENHEFYCPGSVVALELIAPSLWRAA